MCVFHYDVFGVYYLVQRVFVWIVELFVCGVRMQFWMWEILRCFCCFCCVPHVVLSVCVCQSLTFSLPHFLSLSPFFGTPPHFFHNYPILHLHCLPLCTGSLALTVPTSFGRPQDARAGTSDSRQYRYHFNICGNASVPQTVDSNGNNPCTENQQWPVSPGYQYGVNQQLRDQCFQLADPYSDPQFMLFDDYNPARGVVLRMPGGEDKFCQPPAGSTQPAHRHLDVALDCYPGIKDNVPDVELIYEKYACQYTIYLQSHWGCPLECMAGADSTVCSNHGVCGYNRDDRRSMCYCDTGFTGDHCDTRAFVCCAWRNQQRSVLSHLFVCVHVCMCACVHVVLRCGFF